MSEIQERLFREERSMAEIPRRVTAFVIDDLLVSVIFMIILWGPMQQSGSIEGVIAIVNAAWLPIVLVKILYQTFFVWQYGATLGKMAMRIEVVEAVSLAQPGFNVAFNRAVFRVVSEVVLYIGFVWALFDPNRQAWHDKTASTLVVNG